MTVVSGEIAKSFLDDSVLLSGPKLDRCNKGLGFIRPVVHSVCLISMDTVWHVRKSSELDSGPGHL